MSNRSRKTEPSDTPDTEVAEAVEWPDPEAENLDPEPAPSPPEEVEDTKVASPPTAPAPPVQRVPLAVFLKLSGKRQDQFAGFAHYAKKNALAPRSVKEWRAEFESFQNRPTR